MLLRIEDGVIARVGLGQCVLLLVGTMNFLGPSEKVYK